MPDEEAWLRRLELDGLLRRDADRLRTTRRWQAAMARAALRLYDTPGEDLRAPIACALIELYGDSLDDDSIVECVQVMLPIEAAELSPRT